MGLRAVGGKNNENKNNNTNSLPNISAQGDAWNGELLGLEELKNAVLERKALSTTDELESKLLFDLIALGAQKDLKILVPRFNMGGSQKSWFVGSFCLCGLPLGLLDYPLR